MISEAIPVTDFWTDVEAPPNPPQLQAVSIDPKKTALLLLDFLRKAAQA